MSAMLEQMFYRGDQERGQLIIKLKGRQVRYTPYMDGLYAMKMLLRIQSQNTFKRVFKYDVTEAFIQSSRDTLDPNHHFRSNCVWAMSGLPGTSKSMSVFSLLKIITNNTRVSDFFFFSDQQILDAVKELPKDIFIVRDEGTHKATFGEGSNRSAMQLQVLFETCRKAGISVCFIEPSFVEYDIAKYYLETVDMDVEHRVTRVALRDPHTMNYIGAIYVPVVAEDDPDWMAYNVKKDNLIDRMRSGEIIDAKANLNDMVESLIPKIDLEQYRTKGERKTLVQQEYPTFTTGEIKTICVLLEMRLRQIKQRGELAELENESG